MCVGCVCGMCVGCVRSDVCLRGYERSRYVGECGCGSVGVGVGVWVGVGVGVWVGVGVCIVEHVVSFDMWMSKQLVWS